MAKTTIVGSQIRDGSIAQVDLDPNISLGAAVTTGTIAPTSTPARIGDFYINSNTGSIYMASGISGYWNWALIGQGSLSDDYTNNIVGWWDASNGPTPVTNGSVITAWNDRSSYVNHLTGTNGVKPTYYTGIQNGLPACYFNGINAGIGGGNLADIAQPATHFLVFKPTGWGRASQEAIISMYNGSSPHEIYRNSGSTTVNMHAGTGLLGPSLSDNTCYVVTTIFNGTSSSIQKNVDVATSGNAGTNTNTMYPAIGERGAGSYFYQGYVMEWRVYAGALTSAQQVQVQTFLNNKWGIY